MLIIGAQGFEKEVLGILSQNKYQKEIAFYHELKLPCPDLSKFKFYTKHNN